MIIVGYSDPKILHSDSSLEIKSEIVKLCHKLYEDTNNKITYIEIGIYYGGTFKYILDKCKDIEIKGIGIDLFEDFDKINKDKENTHSQAAVASLASIKYALEEKGFNNFKLLKGDSLKLLNSLKPMDNVICFIDGNHTYEAVKGDFFSSLEKINNGYIILDDINTSIQNYGVNKLYQEIKNDYPIVFENNRNVIFKIN